MPTPTSSPSPASVKPSRSTPAGFGVRCWRASARRRRRAGFPDLARRGAAADFPARLAQLFLERRRDELHDGDAGLDAVELDLAVQALRNAGSELYEDVVCLGHDYLLCHQSSWRHGDFQLSNGAVAIPLSRSEQAYLRMISYLPVTAGQGGRRRASAPRRPGVVRAPAPG